MPMPNFMRFVNKRVFNRRELAKGQRPVLTHTGRSSGQSHRIPLEAMPIQDGYGFVLMYGADRTDWVKNVLASGSGTLTINGAEHRLTNPRVEVGEAAWARLPAGYRRPPGLLKVTELLFMDIEDGNGESPTG